ncbi:MAG: patatin-like phospholipase family protein [Gammaproteobacteria bacterium]|nr:patatin-like phospholipase family protein [Gammaproteobacteria bacterium]
MGQSISLVLGSGGARGYAHIGVIEVLEEAGFEIRAIVGSSMGALIGGLYANGTLDQYKEWVLTLEFMDILRLVDFTLDKTGMIKGDRVFERMATMLGDTTIESLPIDFTAVATDLVTHREVWLQRGSLKDAIRASIAIPMLLRPVRRGGRLLVDGGILNPLPVAPTVSHQCDAVFAVNLNAIQSPGYAVTPSVEEQQRQEAFGLSLTSFFGTMSRSTARKQRSTMGKLDLLSRTFECMQLSLSSYKNAGYPADLTIEIPAESCRFYDFHRAYEMIEVGRRATRELLDARGWPGGNMSVERSVVG